MKIGILTHHYINNFGAFLQAYALMKYVAGISPKNEVFIINYINRKHYFVNKCGWMRFYRERENFNIWAQKLKVARKFDRCRRSTFNLTKKCITVNDINSLNLDCIIVGSDEVWNYCDRKANDPIKFGIGLKCNKLISYAPSVGQAVGEVPQYVVSGISLFSHVSARDDLTESFLKKYRDDVIRVVDPTFLVELPAEPMDSIKKPYILFYYCDGLSRTEKQYIFEYAKENSLAVYGAGEGDRDYSDITVAITPFQWIWLFRNAKYVITGTFHGVVFSLLNHKNFACYLTNPSRVAKVNSLLEEFGLQDRIVNGVADEIITVAQRDVDYNAFERIAKVKVEASKQYLINVLGD